MPANNQKSKIKNQKLLAVAFVLALCSPNVAGQEPADTTVVVSHAVLDTTVSSAAALPDDAALNRSAARPDIVRLSDTAALAQVYPVDTLDTYAKHSPAKAAIMSAVLPGLGQAYNRKYWKMPIVYAAVGVSVGVFIYRQNIYSEWRRAYIDYNDNDPYTNYWKTVYPFDKYNVDVGSTITRAKDRYRTWRDWSIVAMVVAYALNIIDANVDAHLMDFSLDDNISLNIRPCFFENDLNYKKFALTLQFTF